ncbi:MAG: metallophosphoesterase family protein [Dehalococcoidia bacterium]
MRIAVVTDVHANLAALEAVLKHAEVRRALDAVWSLGDFVGYGPQPNEIIQLLLKQRLYGVIGNHDLAAIGGMDTRDFNREAALANEWTGSQLDAESIEFLQGLSEIVVREAQHSTFCHGSLRRPIWEYLFTKEAAKAQFERMTTLYSFVGHTHIPLIYEEVRETGQIIEYRPVDGDLINLGDRRLILNPGGVGQPRDGDPRAAYAIYDTDDATVEFQRIPYQIAKTQALMQSLGLPKRLIDRLSAGR